MFGNFCLIIVEFMYTHIEEVVFVHCTEVLLSLWEVHWIIRSENSKSILRSIQRKLNNVKIIYWVVLI